MKRLLALTATLVLALAATAQCSLPTTKGTDFWVAFLANNGEAGTLEMSIIATCDQSATITVTNPYTGWGTTTTLTASGYSDLTQATIVIPHVQGLIQTSSAPSWRGLHVTSTADCWLAAANTRIASSDVATILPTSQLGTRYIVQDYPNGIDIESAQLGGSEVLFLATEDSTVLEMVIPCATMPVAAPVGGTLRVTLMQGQTYLLISPTPGEFTGMEVTSNGKPFAMFQGNRITAVPNGSYSSGDHIYEQAVPVNSWGTDFVAVASHGRSWGDIVRITAADEVTIVSANGTPVDTIQPFGSIDYHLPAQSAKLIHTSSPVSATLLMASSTWMAEEGDVSSVTLTPMDAGVCEALFTLFPTERCQSYYLAVAVARNDAAGVMLDGNSIASQFVMGGTFRHALLPVSAGSHRLSSTSGTFTAYAYGIGNVESYAFPLARSFAEYNHDTIVIVDTVCQGQRYDTLGLHLASNVTSQLGDTTVLRDVLVGTTLTHYIVQLTVMPVYNIFFQDSINYGDTLWVGDTALTTSGFYQIFSSSVYGCDSVVSIMLAVKADTIDILDTACQGRPYSGHGFSLADPQRNIVMQRDTVIEGTPCIFRLFLTVLPSPVTEVHMSIVLGDTLTYADSTITAAGDYSFAFTAASGCDSTLLLHVGYQEIGINSDLQGVCPGDPVMLTATGTHTFRWASTPHDTSLDAQQGRNPIVVHPTQTTVYSILDDAGNAVASITVGTASAPLLCIEVNRSDLDFDNPVLLFTDCSEGRHHTLWTFDDGTIITGSKVRRTFHHPLPDSVGVAMHSCNQYECCSDTTVVLPMKIRSVWFPNTFTPNADANNRFAGLTSLDVSEFSLVIFNRWGLEIWSSDDIGEPWDGRRSDGSTCPQGAYVYRYHLRSPDGTFVHGIGTVTLLR